MGKFERNFIYPCLQTLSNFYCLFICDLVLPWNGSETQLLDFITRLNSRQPTKKFWFYIFKIQHLVVRHKDLQKQAEEHITDDNILETNRSVEFFGSYLSTLEIID